MPPDASAMLRKADAALLIGDPALRLSIEIEGGAERGPSGEQVCAASLAGIPDAGSLHVYDVVEEWRRMTDLPAVLAVWAARPEVATPEVVADFTASRDLGLARIKEISLDAARELQLPGRVLESYLRHNIDFSLGVENRQGLELYYRYAANLGLIPQARPIEWAPAKAKAVKL
jgi:chorismate dehydratase